MSRRRGFTLYEILIALALFLIVLDTAGQLFNSVFKLTADNQRLGRQTSRIDSALRQLRGDTWGCSNIAVGDSHSVELTVAKGKVAWLLNTDGSVQRTGPDSQSEQWPAIGRDWTFASEGPALVVSDRVSYGPQAVRLVSQVLLSRRTP
jgi:prepilin-type N-terminal cleavage/methylation domain-containing protein